jgi:hypothetical protein
VSYDNYDCARELDLLQDRVRTLHQLTSLKYDVDRRATTAARRTRSPKVRVPSSPRSRRWDHLVPVIYGDAAHPAVLEHAHSNERE